MNSLDLIREKIQKMYETNPQILINVKLSRPKVNLKNEAVTIKGVYPHFFIIEEQSDGLAKEHTLQYSDILIGCVEIQNLDKSQCTFPVEKIRKR